MLTLFSPAKINLFLRIVGRRTDGYHDLASLFQTISLGDTLHFALAAKDQLTCTDPSIPTDASNLILKAAQLFRKKTGLSFGLNVHLEKKIPSQAGLGGGSGNAATTLWALNALHDYPATVADLQIWSSEIGSDISFFFSKGIAYCTGRGECIEEMSPLPPQKVTIIKPDTGLPTPAVYARFRRLGFPNHFTSPEEDLESFFSPKSSLITRYVNDLEPAAFAEAPSLAELKQNLLASGFTTVLMAGSGSAFFCLGEGELRSYAHLFRHDAVFIYRKNNDWFISHQSLR
jgi:4-diphosphocytidyl-2-C-methyl-D-erythritol kinase